MRIIKVPDDLNQRRVRIISKGYISKKDLCEFIPAGKRKGERIYNEIAHQAELEGFFVSEVGLSVERVLDYFHLDENKIRRYAKEGY